MTLPSPRSRNAREAWLCLATAATIVMLVFLWQGRVGLNLADEGFLWYGAQRVARGEVPLRDFMSYDPGRYYWSAAFMLGGGDCGIITLRVAAAAFQAIGLFVGILLVRRASSARTWAFALCAGVVLTAWMLPRHKLFDISVSLGLIGALSLLIARPTRLRFAVAGAAVGVAAFFGKNHGAYGVAGSLAAMAYLAAQQDTRSAVRAGLAPWVGGLVVGCLPALAMAVAIPGFAQALWESVLFLFELKATNIPLPVPWPWVAMPGQPTFAAATLALLVGILFMATAAFAVGGLPWAFRRKIAGRALPPAFTACACLALPYAHFAFSRADLGHLALGIFPMLLGVCLLLGSARAAVAWPGLLALAATTAMTAARAQPGFALTDLDRADVGGDHLELDGPTANDAKLFAQLAADPRAGGAACPFLVTPLRPGSYAVANVKAPVWEIYALVPRSEEFQLAEIRRIAAAQPEFVLIEDSATDGRDDLRYPNTHRLIDAFVRSHYEPEAGFPGHPVYRMYRRKTPAEGATAPTP